jgi:hypothetical protein
MHLEGRQSAVPLVLETGSTTLKRKMEVKHERKYVYKFYFRHWNSRLELSAVRST